MVESLFTAVLGSGTLMPTSGSMIVLLGIRDGMGRNIFNRRTQLYVINGNLNSHRYIDQILRAIVMPF